MSWFTNLFSKLFSAPKESAEKTVSAPAVNESISSVSPSYLGFYHNDIVFYNETFAKHSLIKGEYIHIDEFREKEEELAFINNVDESFEDFDEAYDVFCILERKKAMDYQQMLRACNSLVIMFNKQYSSVTVLRSKTFAKDYLKYFRVVQLMLSYDLPILIQADLYRQISLFKKCMELLNSVRFQTAFECELCDEIRYRACNNIRHPFMICDVDNLRPYSNDSNRPTYLDWFFDVHYRINFGTPIYRTALGGGN